MSFLRLFGKLSLDGSGFEKTLAKADNQGKQFSNRMEGYFRGLGNTILGAFTGASLLRGIKKLADEADRILNLTEELEISAKLAQEVGFAFERGGLSKEAGNESLRGLLRQIRAAKGGSQSAIDLLSSLGVQGVLLRPELTVEEALNEIVANFRKQGSTATQSQREAVQQVFLSRATPALLELSRGGLPSAKLENIQAVDRGGDRGLSFWQRAQAVGMDMLGYYIRRGPVSAPIGMDNLYRSVKEGVKDGMSEVNDRP